MRALLLAVALLFVVACTPQNDDTPRVQALKSCLSELRADPSAECV